MEPLIPILISVITSSNQPCDPYKQIDGTSCTDPPQDPAQLELWEIEGSDGARHHHLQSSEKPITLEKWRAPKPKETCVFIKEDLGLGSYSGWQSIQPAIGGSVFPSSSCPKKIKIFMNRFTQYASVMTLKECNWVSGNSNEIFFWTCIQSFASFWCNGSNIWRHSSCDFHVGFELCHLQQNLLEMDGWNLGNLWSLWLSYHACHSLCLKCARMDVSLEKIGCGVCNWCWHAVVDCLGLLLPYRSLWPKSASSKDLLYSRDCRWYWSLSSCIQGIIDCCWGTRQTTQTFQFWKWCNPMVVL